MIGELFTVATNMGEIGDMIKKHPLATGAIVFGGGLVLLWAFGYLGGSSSSSSSAASGTNNLAAAYYAAEAAQTTAGTQLQIAQVAGNTQEALATTQANAAVAINGAQQDALTTLGGQSATTAQTAYNDNLVSSTTSANDAAYEAVTGSNNALETTFANNQTSEVLAALNGIIPQQLAMGAGADYNLPGFGTISAGAHVPSVGPLSGPTQAASLGFTPAEIQAMFG
jgi:hypothetical protein